MYNMHKFGAKSVRGRRWKVSDFDRYIYEAALYTLTEDFRGLMTEANFLPWVNGMLTDYNIIWGCGLI